MLSQSAQPAVQSPHAGMLSHVRARLRRLGLDVSLWEPSGAMIAAPACDNAFCQRMCQGGGCYRAAMSQLAQKVASEGVGGTAIGPSGCCLAAAPVHQRRRLVAVAIACFPASQTADSDVFQLACSRNQLDSRFMAGVCRQNARHSTDEAASFADMLEWLIGYEQGKEVARDELGTLSSNLASTYEELSLLYRVSGSVNVTQSSMEFLTTLCGELLEVMQVQATAAVLYPRDHSDQTQSRVVSAGAFPLSTDQFIQVAQRYLAPRLNGTKSLIDNQFAQHAAHLGPRVAQIHSLVAVPLMVSGNCKGILVGVNKAQGGFDSVDQKLISSVGGQVAVFLENRHLYEGLQDLLMGVLHALTSSIDAKDPYTCGHSRRVATIAQRLSKLAGYDDKRVSRIYLAGLLHDIGKIGIPEAVLCKNGRLTDAEYDSVKRHPEVGAMILGGIRQMEDVLPAILHHHERPDGRGYPKRLAGRDVPPEALIVGLADSFDAMTTSRTYRKAMPLAAVLSEIRRCSGTQFDPRMVEILLSLDLEAFLVELRDEGAARGVQGAGSVALSA